MRAMPNPRRRHGNRAQMYEAVPACRQLVSRQYRDACPGGDHKEASFAGGFDNSLATRSAVAREAASSRTPGMGDRIDRDPDAASSPHSRSMVGTRSIAVADKVLIVEAMLVASKTMRPVSVGQFGEDPRSPAHVLRAQARPFQSPRSLSRFLAFVEAPGDHARRAPGPVPVGQYGSPTSIAGGDVSLYLGKDDASYHLTSWFERLTVD